jgi:hypothetical protein
MCVASLFETDNVAGAIVISLFALLLVGILYAGTRYETGITRTFGSSLITSSIGWFLYIASRTHSWALGLIASLLNLIITLVVMNYGIEFNY